MAKKVFSNDRDCVMFFLGSWLGTPRVSSNAYAFVAPVGGQIEIECGNTTWNFYCAGQPGCDCIQIDSGSTGCGDSASGSCCKTCFR